MTQPNELAKKQGRKEVSKKVGESKGELPSLSTIKRPASSSVGEGEERLESRTQKRKKRSRRKANQIERSHHCHIKGCEKSYGTEGALRTHIKTKHAVCQEHLRQQAIHHRRHTMLLHNQFLMGHRIIPMPIPPHTADTEEEEEERENPEDEAATTSTSKEEDSPRSVPHHEKEKGGKMEASGAPLRPAPPLVPVGGFWPAIFACIPPPPPPPTPVPMRRKNHKVKTTANPKADSKSHDPQGEGEQKGSTSSGAAYIEDEEMKLLFPAPPEIPPPLLSQKDPLVPSDERCESPTLVAHVSPFHLPPVCITDISVRPWPNGSYYSYKYNTG